VAAGSPVNVTWWLNIIWLAQKYNLTLYYTRPQCTWAFYISVMAEFLFWPSFPIHPNSSSLDHAYLNSSATRNGNFHLIINNYNTVLSKYYYCNKNKTFKHTHISKASCYSWHSNCLIELVFETKINLLSHLSMPWWFFQNQCNGNKRINIWKM
jgi:hypothetical protein